MRDGGWGRPLVLLLLVQDRVEDLEQFLLLEVALPHHFLFGVRDYSEASREG